MPSFARTAGTSVRAVSTIFVGWTLVLSTAGCTVGIRRTADPPTIPCPTTAATAHPTPVAGPGAGPYRPEQLVAVLLPPNLGVDVTECGTQFGYQPDIYGSDPYRVRESPTSVSPPACAEEAEMLQGSAPLDSRLNGASIALRRFQGEGLGGGLSLMSAPDDALTQTSRPLPPGCERFTVVRHDGLEITYRVFVFLPVEIGVNAPEGAELLIRRTESPTPDGVVSFYVTSVTGGGLAAIVLFISAIEDSDADKLARQRSVAELAIHQWQVASESLR